MELSTTLILWLSRRRDWKYFHALRHLAVVMLVHPDQNGLLADRTALNFRLSGLRDLPLELGEVLSREISAPRRSDGVGHPHGVPLSSKCGSLNSRHS